MPVARARSSGIVSRIVVVVALAGGAACSKQSTAPTDADLPQRAGDVLDPPSSAAKSSPAAAAPTDEGAKSPVSRADAGTDAATDAGAPVELAPFHIVGRFDARDPVGPRFGWSGTELRARFSGAGLSIILSDTGTDYYDVSIDGSMSAPLVVTGGATPYVVASGLAAGEHDLILTKRTETAAGVTQLQGFVGTLVPTPPPPPSVRRIELVGDSISCGFGVLGTSAACEFSPTTEDEALAWGALAAKQLGALHMVTAVSGIGLLRNFGGDTADTMPARYDRALSDDSSSSWDHHAFEPDVIVVELGTNDIDNGKGDPGPPFQTAYTSFLAALRARHANAQIVAATSPMLLEPDRTTLRAYVTAAVDARHAAGDAKVSWLEIEQQNGSDGYGCDFHPNVTTQEAMAAALVTHVKSVMPW